MHETWTETSFNKALSFAARAHHGQTMPSSDLPYLLHLSRVAMEVMIALHAKSGLDHTLAIQCAWLHDTLEDTKVSATELELGFGSCITAGVQALTKDKSLPRAESMADSLARIKKQPAEIWMVKMADRIANLGPPPGHWGREKAIAYRHEAMRIHAELKDANTYLGHRLESKIAEYLKYYEGME